MRIYLALATLVFVSAGVLLFLQTPNAQALYTCNAYQSFHRVPTGYGAVYDVFQSNKEVFINADCGNDDFRINIGHAGHTASNFAVYKTGYRWTGSTWEAITFTTDGGSVSGNYILGKAKSAGDAIDYSSGANSFFVAFTCSKQAGVWKCGCSDSTCATHKWQLQAATKGGSFGIGTNTDTDDNTPAGDASASFEGMHLVAQHVISASEVGNTLTKEHLFGEYGLSARTVKPPLANFRTIGRAPDGRVAIQENIPQGTVPETTSYSHHFGNGATKGGFMIDVWIPEDFRYPTACTYPGQGRLPFGLWAGLPTKTSQPSGGGQSIASQDSVSFRVNRSREQVYPSAYIYNLNRYHPVCETLGVCSSIAACNSVNFEGCYGSGGKVADIATPRGRWVTFEGIMTMNNPGAKDGCISLKAGGTTIYNKCGHDFGRDKGWLVQGFYGYGMWHCNNSPKEQKWWYSNLRMYSN